MMIGTSETLTKTLYKTYVYLIVNMWHGGIINLTVGDYVQNSCPAQIQERKRIEYHTEELYKRVWTL